MQFRLAEQVLERHPDYCVGVVVAEWSEGAAVDAAAVETLLQEAAAGLPDRLAGMPLRDHPAVAVWRTAFRAFDINPNRFPPSIEALAGRILKGSPPPLVNGPVNLANAAALRFLLPMGTHDLDPMQGDLEVRIGREGDWFTPMGADSAEPVPPGEPVYADALEVRTRRWIWRQGEKAKVTPASRRIFFPIDGFIGKTDQAVEAATAWLARHLPQLLGARVTVVGRVDAHHPALGLDGSPVVS